MAKPTKPVPPAPALRSNPDAFRVNAEANILFLFTTLLDYVDSVADFTDEQADAALAAALGGTLPPIVGQALKFIRVNAGETAAEFISAPLATRVITGTANQIAVTNGDGVAGNPTLSAVFASQAEAEARVDTTKLVNVLRAAQTAAAVITSILASQAEAEAGTDNTKLMTPLRSRQHLLASEQGRLLATWDHAVTGSVSAIVMPAFAGMESLLFDGFYVAGGRLMIQFSTDGGATWLATGYSSYAADGVGTDNGSSGIIIGRNADGWLNGTILGLRANELPSYLGLFWATANRTGMAGGRYGSAITPNLARLVPATGNVTAGRIRFYAGRRSS